MWPALPWNHWYHRTGLWAPVISNPLIFLHRFISILSHICCCWTQGCHLRPATHLTGSWLSALISSPGNCTQMSSTFLFAISYALVTKLWCWGFSKHLCLGIVCVCICLFACCCMLTVHSFFTFSLYSHGKAFPSMPFWHFHFTNA